MTSAEIIHFHKSQKAFSHNKNLLRICFSLTRYFFYDIDAPIRRLTIRITIKHELS